MNRQADHKQWTTPKNLNTLIGGPLFFKDVFYVVANCHHNCWSKQANTKNNTDYVQGRNSWIFLYVCLFVCVDIITISSNYDWTPVNVTLTPFFFNAAPNLMLTMILDQNNLNHFRKL